MFQFQALGCRRSHRGFDRGNLHRLTLEGLQRPLRRSAPSVPMLRSPRAPERRLPRAHSPQARSRLSLPNASPDSLFTRAPEHRHLSATGRGPGSPYATTPAASAAAVERFNILDVACALPRQRPRAARLHSVTPRPTLADGIPPPARRCVLQKSVLQRYLLAQRGNLRALRRHDGGERCHSGSRGLPRAARALGGPPPPHRGRK